MWSMWNLVFFPFFFFFFFGFLGLHPWHIEVSRLGVELELQLPIYTTATAMPDLRHVVTYTIADGNTRSLTHWARPGIEPVSSWILVRFVFAEPQQELLVFFLLKKITPYFKKIEHFANYKGNTLYFLLKFVRS